MPFNLYFGMLALFQTLQKAFLESAG